ncbi:unnamed protein product [Dicrocoelium dendriticum]|nr:unnamed protein product [Dicrocoelium dendriticum]
MAQVRQEPGDELAGDRVGIASSAPVSKYSLRSLTTARTLEPQRHRPTVPPKPPDLNCRPIAPKPLLVPHHSLEFSLRWTSPMLITDSPLPTEQTPRDSNYVLFSLYGQYTAAPSKAAGEQRTNYANAVIPQKRLRVLGRQTLFLKDAIPKNRAGKSAQIGFQNPTDSLDVSPTSAVPTSTTDPHSDSVWSCSHTAVPPEGVQLPSHKSFGNSSEQPASPETIACGRLRPSARLLVRIGHELTRAQYRHMTVIECGCGLVRSPKSVGEGERAVSECVHVTTDVCRPATSVPHLEWRPKDPHQRWTRVRDLCKTHNCPFIPTSIFLLHRHLELGHQSLLRCISFRSLAPEDGSVTLAEEKEAILGSTSKLAAPMILNVFSLGTRKIKCPVCDDRNYETNTVLKHIRSVHPFLAPQPMEVPSNHLCAICGCPLRGKSGPGRPQFTLCGALIHSQCSPRTTAYQYAAWSGHNAHPLACLMLHPNQHSRVAFPTSTVSQMYRPKVAIPPYKSPSNGSHLDVAVEGVSDGTTLHRDSNASAIANTSHSIIATSDADKSHVISPPCSSSLPSSASEPPVACTTSAVVDARASRKRMSVDNAEFDPTVCKKTYVLSALNEPTSSSSALPVETNLLPNGLSKATGPSSNDPLLATRRSHPVIARRCELCSMPVFVQTHRLHLVEVHRRKLGFAPTNYCIMCGQLSWTVEGNQSHQRVRCFVCSTTAVCRSTLYIHLAIKHPQELAEHLCTKHTPCLLCSCFPESILLHLLREHSCVIPMDIIRFLAPELRTDYYTKDGRQIFLHDIAPLYISAVSRHRKPPANPTSFPEGLASQDPTNPNWWLFKCSVCQTKFISACQLDLHMLLSGHQYWCPYCPFACTSMRALAEHMNDSCVKKKGQFKFIRLQTPTKSKPPDTSCPATAAPIFTTSLPTPNVSHVSVSLTPSVCAPVVHSTTTTTTTKESLPLGIRTTIGPISQFHGCDLCPVFCLTLEDLSMHRRTVHRCAPLLDVSTPTTIASIASTATSLQNNSPAFDSLIASSSQIDATLLNSHNRLIAPAPPARIVPLAIPGQSIVRSTVPILPPVLVVPRATVGQLAVLPPPPSSDVTSEELFCPMCEFRSTDRSQIMQHVQDSH